MFGLDKDSLCVLAAAVVVEYVIVRMSLVSIMVVVVPVAVTLLS